MNPLLSLLVVYLLLPLPASAQDIGMLTLIEGPLRIIRGTTVFKGAQGVRLYPGDIIESSDAGFVQLEFTGGSIVALGGSTRVVLFGQAGRNARSVGNGQELVLLSGWLKSQSGSAASASRYNSPLLAAATQDGAVVIHASAKAAEIFVESGSARIAEVSADGNWRAPHVAKAGQFSSRQAGKNVSSSSKPSSTFVEEMPHPFRDSFSSLTSHFAGKPPQPKRDHDVTYSEIQPWLTMSPTWRKGFVKRFQARLTDPAFHKAVETHLKDHPEWDALLHPEQTSPPAVGNLNPQDSGRLSK